MIRWLTEPKKGRETTVWASKTAQLSIVVARLQLPLLAKDVRCASYLHNVRVGRLLPARPKGHQAPLQCIGARHNDPSIAVLANSI